MVRVCALDGCEITFPVVVQPGKPQRYCSPAHRKRARKRGPVVVRLPPLYDMAARIGFLVAQREWVRTALKTGRVREALAVILVDAAADLPQGPAR